MRRWIGPLLMGTAVLHNVVGVIFYATPLWDIGQAGLFNAVDPYYDRGAAFWFLMFGVMLFLLGVLVQWVVRETETVPTSLGWGLVILGSIGVILMPLSGFWLIFPQAYMIFRVSRQDVQSSLSVG